VDTHNMHFGTDMQLFIRNTGSYRPTNPYRYAFFRLPF